jgi:polysaccharide biosynthesis protein PslH
LKVLYLTPRVPYPPLRGDQLVAFHRLRILGRRHEITLLSFCETAPDREAIAELSKYVVQLEFVRLPKIRSLANVALRGLFTRQPLQVVYFQSREFRRRLGVLLDETRFDIVHAFFHRTAPYLPQAPRPRVLDAMDSLELRLGQQAANARWPERWILGEELRRMRRYERRVHEVGEAVIVVSLRDAHYFPEGKVHVVENGVDQNRFQPNPRLRRPGHLVFGGRIGYAPNAEAARWFAIHCLPLIQERVPAVTLSIAGADPPRDVRALGRIPGVKVTGYVDSIASALNEASVVVVPLQSASGIQNKILEAMACARPVVTTAVGLGAIAARHGREVLIAEGREAFADAVVSLLEDESAAEEMGRCARAFVIANHTWEHAGELVDQIYCDLSASSVDP